MLASLAAPALASFFAGLVDAVIGGGGLILLPSLFAAFPGAAPATLLGTNKSAAVCGTSWAAAQYARRVRLPSATLLAAVTAAIGGSALGAFLVTRASPVALRRVLPFVLAAVLVYTLVRKNVGQVHAPRFGPHAEARVAAVIGFVIGSYDGFFGPGTGTLLSFAFVRLLGYDFLHASASARVVNTATNVAAIALFASDGHVWWGHALVLGVANVLGSLVGTRLALRHGARFVRIMFLAVVLALLARTAFDAYG